MDATISKIMNPVQMMIINSFATATTAKEEEEVRDLLLNYYNSKLQTEMSKLWDDGTLNQEKLDEMKQEHFRTPYNKRPINV